MKTRSVSKQTTTRINASRDRRGTRSDKNNSLPTQGIRYSDPTVCDACGAVYTRKTWRTDHPVTHAMLEQAEWAHCPACRQKSEQIAYGRVLVGGTLEGTTLSAVQRRIRNVEARANHTQPEHSIVSMEKSGDGLEILTTSQQLAHRIVHELKKAFHGRACYRWSDNDGSLYATWRG